MTMISSLKSEYHVTNFSSHMSTNEECPNTGFYLVQILKFGLKYGLVIRPNKSRVLAYAEDAWKVKYLPK